MKVIKFDLLGQRRLEFGESGVTHVTNEIYPIPVPGFGSVSVATNRQVDYADVLWIGQIRKRQWWALAVGILGLGLGAFWMVQYFGEWGPFGVSTGFLALFGVVPLAMFFRGRPFLAIATERELISLPMDRKRKQVRQSIEALREQCVGEDIEWHL